MSEYSVNQVNLKTFQLDAFTCIGCSHVRAGGTLSTSDDVIVDMSQSLISTLGDKRLSHIFEIFADTQHINVLLLQLNLLGTVEARLIDAQGSVFWAKITSDGDSYLIEDIDLAKSFMFDCEDMIDEQERSPTH